MQKRANLAIEYAPIELDPQFPVESIPWFEQGDSPIRFLHFHSCLEIGFCFEGNGIFVVGDKIMPFSAGDVSFISGTEVHLARSAPGTTSHWIWIYLDPPRLISSPHAGEELDISGWSGSGFSNIISGEQYPQIASVVSRMAEELREKRAGQVKMIRALTWQLLLEMERTTLPLNETRTAFSRSHYDQIAPALAWMVSGEATVNVGKLAALCHLSEAHFRRLFKATLGRTPRDYASDLKMRLAASLLHGTTQPVLTIAHAVGFHSLSSFNRVFLKTYGQSPREWRKKKPPPEDDGQESKD